MSIHNETEAEIRAERIDPVLAAVGWGQSVSMVRRQVICQWRIQSGDSVDDLTQSLSQRVFVGGMK